MPAPTGVLIPQCAVENLPARLARVDIDRYIANAIEDAGGEEDERAPDCFTDRGCLSGSCINFAGVSLFRVRLVCSPQMRRVRFGFDLAASAVDAYFAQQTLAYSRPDLL